MILRLSLSSIIHDIVCVIDLSNLYRSFWIEFTQQFSG